MYLLADIPLNGSYQRSHDLHNCILQTRLQYPALMLSFVVEEGFDFFRDYPHAVACRGVSIFFHECVTVICSCRDTRIERYSAE